MTRAAPSLALALAAMLSVQPPPTVDFDRGVREVLTRTLQFTAGEFADLQRGHPVKHGLDARAPGEFAVAGAIKVAAARAAFLDAARDIVKFKAGQEILEIGRFSASPVIDDLAALTVGKADFDASRCRVRDCDIRLPAAVIQRVAKEIDVKGRTAQEETSAWFKQMLLANVQAYVSGSPRRFAQYDDGDRPIRPIDDFAGLLAATPAVGTLVPGLPEHLARFPEAPLPEAEDFLYWSKESFGPAPFISVTHVTIVCAAPHTCVMTTKDVYSTRYIDASLAVAVVTDSMTGDATYVVYANRSRINALRGTFSALRKSLVERRARNTLEQSLVRIKTRLEHK